MSTPHQTVGAQIIGGHRLARRLSVPLTLCLLLVSWQATGWPTATAQEASPTLDALPTALADWVAGWEAEPPDAARIASAYTEDGVYEEVATGVARGGRAAIETYLTGFFAAFADGRAEVTTIFATGDRAAATWTWTGHYTNQLAGFPPPAGQAVTFRGASILDLRDGRIARETQYFDVYGLLAQLGVVPSPSSADGGTPEP